MWKFIVDVVHDFVSSLQPDVGRGFLHVTNVFLFLIYIHLHGSSPLPNNKLYQTRMNDTTESSMAQTNVNSNSNLDLTNHKS